MRAAGWDTEKLGYILPDVDSQTGRYIPGPGSGTNQAVRFVRQLQEWGLYDGESLHGTRTGNSATLQMQGEDNSTVQAAGGWAGKQWPEYYGAGALIAAVSGRPVADLTPAEYRAINNRPSDLAERSKYAL